MLSPNQLGPIAIFPAALAPGPCLSTRRRLLLRLLRLLAAGHLPRRSQDHVYCIPFHTRPEFHDPLIANLSHQALQHLTTQVLVSHFSSAEAQAGRSEERRV